MHRIVHLFYFSLFKAMLICYNKKQRKESKQHLAHDEENIADAEHFTILRMSGMVGMMGITLKEKNLPELNRKRNKIKIHKK